MTAKDQLARPEAPRAFTLPSLGDIPQSVHAILSGVVGASTVALFFLLIDVAVGRPLWTPAALGSLLFLGEPLAEGAGTPAILVLAYTATHGTVFIGFGIIAAFLVSWRQRPLDPKRVVLLAVLLFAAIQAAFLSLGLVFMPEVLTAIGVGRVAVANLLAAGAMAGYLKLTQPATAAAAAG